MGPEDLRQMTSLLKQPLFKDLVIGFEDSEDCGAFVLDSQGQIILNTVDFITPIVDDPYIYGQIAAANSLHLPFFSISACFAPIFFEISSLCVQHYYSYMQRNLVVFLI